MQSTWNEKRNKRRENGKDKERKEKNEKVSRELDATALLTAVLRLSLFSNEYAP